MEKEGLERRYSIFAAVLILVVYALAYLVSPNKSPVYPTIIAVGFVIGFILFFLLLVYLFENVLGTKLDYLNKILDFSFVNLLGESIALIFSFFFYITLMTAFDLVIGSLIVLQPISFMILASFNLVIGSLVVLQPLSFMILSSFNHLHYKNKRTINIFALVGTAFLLIGFLSKYNSLFLIFTSIALILFSAVSYRVFKIEIPEEIERYQGRI